MDDKNIQGFILEKKRATAKKVVSLQKQFDEKCVTIREEWMSKITNKDNAHDKMLESDYHTEKRHFFQKFNKNNITQAVESQEFYDIVGDLDQFQETINKNRTLSKEKQR